MGGAASRTRAAAGKQDGASRSQIAEDLAAYLTKLLDSSYDALGIDEWPLVKHLAGRPLADLLPVVLVGLIMGTLYFCYGFCYLPLAGGNVMGLGSVVFHVAFAFAVLSYHQAVVTDPGGVPHSWRDGA